MKKRMPFPAIYIWLLLILLAVDQGSKALIRRMALGDQIAVIPGFFWLSHVQNTGASFGMLQNSNTALIFISLIFIGGLLHYHDQFKSKAERIFLTLLFAGVLGNLIDRVFLGSVTDLFDLGWFPVFNVADSCLCIGVFGLILYKLFWKKKAGEKTKQKQQQVGHHS